MVSFYIAIHSFYHVFKHTGGKCTEIKVSDKSLGKYSNCQHVENDRDEGEHTLASCKTDAHAANANVFNFKDEACTLRQCDDITDLKLTEEYGGWDVYKLECEG